MSSPGRILMEMVGAARGFALLTPRMFFFAAASGRRMTSSWSCPHELCPLRSSTPMTRNGMFRMRMICPRGSASAKRFSTVVWPSSATFVAPSTSSPPIGRPATTDQSRASKYSAVTPCTTVAQFELPYTTCSVPRTDGAAAWTVCTSLDRPRIILRDRGPTSVAQPDAARRHAAGKDDDQVRAEALDLLGHTRLGAGTHGHHGDHGADPDDDAEHRESASELVHPQRADGEPGALPDLHATTSASPDARASAASRGEATGSSRSSRPSRNVSTRLA